MFMTVVYKYGVWSSWLLVAVTLCNQCMTFSQAGVPSNVMGYYTDVTSQQTVLFDKIISPRQKKNIRNEILHLLGLQHRPKTQTRMDMNSAPQYMLQLYKALEEERESIRDQKSGHLEQLNVTLPGMENSLEQADLIMSFINQAGIRQLFSDGGRRFYFYFGEVPRTEGVTGAVFRVYKYSSHWLSDRDPFSIRVFKISNDRYRSETVLELETVIALSAMDEGWLEINVTEAIEHWRLDRTEEVVLYMEVTDKQGRDLEPSAIGLVDNQGPKDKQAFLVTCFKANHKLHVRSSRSLDTHRHRRSPSANYYSDEKDYRWRYPPDRPSRRACQRRQLYVSFRALGWESWVIAPEGYPAFYCDGECMFPLNVHMNATNHAIVQALVHLVKPFLAPNPCCAPTTLNAISFLYLDNSYNVVLKNYKNMVVQACGCH